MEIKDLFSHKIHSSGDEWPDKLVELAFLFAEFDDQVFDRDAIEKRLMRISPRSAYLARDRSKFRDEYSAYPAYFGIYHLETSTQGWKIRINETTRQFLLQEEPDVAGFLRLQLSLFQFPNSMGAIYYPRTVRIKVQANARDKTLDYIKNGVHLSPLRLITSSLMADAFLRDVPINNAMISFDEVLALCNVSEINKHALPDPKIVRDALTNARSGALLPPDNYERRFHLLKHLEIFEVGRGTIKVKKGATIGENTEIEKKLRTIASIQNEFVSFDQLKTATDLKDAIISGVWGTYFDAVSVFDSATVQALASNDAQTGVSVSIADKQETTVYEFPLKKRDDISSPSYRPPKVTQREFADPEITGIRRQRRNLVHKIMVDLLDHHLRTLGALPMQNQFIDLYASIPGDGSFLFEIKSGGDNLLSQIRKGLSQLYEYRFRHSNQLSSDVKLCLVIPSKPIELNWVEEYLCDDRQICLCWIDITGKIEASTYCADDLQPILMANTIISDKR